MTTALQQRLLPPNVMVVTVLAMIALRVFSLGPRLIDMPISLIGVVPVIAGLYVTARNAFRFSRVGTNIVTFNDPGTLVDDGWFNRTRNPMYLGFMLTLVGVALTLGTATVWIGPVAFFVAANWWYIPFEERRMVVVFGDDYNRYCKRVRRWI